MGDNVFESNADALKANQDINFDDLDESIQAGMVLAVEYAVASMYVVLFGDDSKVAPATDALNAWIAARKAKA